jgi:hypothetical protein
MSPTNLFPCCGASGNLCKCLRDFLQPSYSSLFSSPSLPATAVAQRAEALCVALAQWREAVSESYHEMKESCRIWANLLESFYRIWSVCLTNSSPGPLRGARSVERGGERGESIANHLVMITESGSTIMNKDLPPSPRFPVPCCCRTARTVPSCLRGRPRPATV